MLLKVIFGLISMTLMVIFVAPVVIKIKSMALVGVILIGMGMMAYDFIEFLREKD
jgi:hypothetical protein